MEILITALIRENAAAMSAGALSSTINHHGASFSIFPSLFSVMAPNDHDLPGPDQSPLQGAILILIYAEKWLALFDV